MGWWEDLRPGGQRPAFTVRVHVYALQHAPCLMPGPRATPATWQCCGGTPASRPGRFTRTQIGITAWLQIACAVNFRQLGHVLTDAARAPAPHLVRQGVVRQLVAELHSRRQLLSLKLLSDVTSSLLVLLPALHAAKQPPLITPQQAADLAAVLPTQTAATLRIDRLASALVPVCQAYDAMLQLLKATTPASNTKARARLVLPLQASLNASVLGHEDAPKVIRQADMATLALAAQVAVRYQLAGGTAVPHSFLDAVQRRVDQLVAAAGGGAAAAAVEATEEAGSQAGASSRESGSKGEAAKGGRGGPGGRSGGDGGRGKGRGRGKSDEGARSSAAPGAGVKGGGDGGDDLAAPLDVKSLALILVTVCRALTAGATAQQGVKVKAGDGEEKGDPLTEALLAAIKIPNTSPAPKAPPVAKGKEKGKEKDKAVEGKGDKGVRAWLVRNAVAVMRCDGGEAAAQQHEALRQKLRAAEDRLAQLSPQFEAVAKQRRAAKRLHKQQLGAESEEADGGSGSDGGSGRDERAVGEDGKGRKVVAGGRAAGKEEADGEADEGGAGGGLAAEWKQLLRQQVKFRNEVAEIKEELRALGPMPGAPLDRALLVLMAKEVAVVAREVAGGGVGPLLEQLVVQRRKEMSAQELVAVGCGAGCGVWDLGKHDCG